MLEKIATKWRDAWHAISVRTGSQVTLTLDSEKHLITDHLGRVADEIHLKVYPYGGSGGRYRLIQTPLFSPDYKFIANGLSPSTDSSSVFVDGVQYFDLDRREHPDGIKIHKEVAAFHLQASGKHAEIWVNEVRPHPTKLGQFIAAVL